MGIPYAEVIGDPIAHSKSPLIHRLWLQKSGLDGDYRAIKVRSDELGDYLATRRTDPDWRGCNVTMPLKEAILPFLDELSPEAGQLGAVNIVTRQPIGLAGENSDVAALRAEILETAENAALLALPVVVIGAGGAARAVLQVLRAVSELEVWILNRSVAKAEGLLGHFGLSGRALALEAHLPPTGLLINASCLGMAGRPELELDLADAGKPFVVDLVYMPSETRLLRQAKVGGMATIDGINILIGQATIAFRRFFSLAPPLGLEEELRKLLSQ